MSAPPSEQSTAPLPIVSDSQPPNRQFPLAAVITIVACVAAAALVGTAAHVGYWQDRILPGTSVADVDVSGLRVDEATSLVALRLERYTQQPLTLTHEGGRWTATPAQLGVRYDVTATVGEAYRVGRAGSPVARLAAWWPVSPRGTRVQAVGVVDQGQLAAFLDRTSSSSINRMPADAAVLINPNDGLRLAPAVAGQALDLANVTKAIQRAAATLSTEPVTLSARPVAPSVDDAALANVTRDGQALLSEPLVLTANVERQTQWEITPPLLLGLIATPTVGGGVALDQPRLVRLLTTFAAEVDRAPVDATLTIESSRQVTIQPHAAGLRLDIEASARAIQAAVASGQHRATLVVVEEPARVTAADLEPSQKRVSALVTRTIDVRYAERAQSLSQDDIAGMLRIVPRPDLPERIAVVADQELLVDLLTSLDRQIRREPMPAVHKYLGGQVTRTAEPVPGRGLDQSGSLLVLTTVLTTAGATVADLPVRTIDPPRTEIDPSQIVIRDVLAEGVTYYGFSLPERRHNVELATGRLNGTLVAPGEVFSFNRSVGHVNTANGYKTGYGIVLTNGAVQTVPSVGGGICQVATTVFHAAFRSGMPIGERNWHFYWIPTYGQAPSGMVGLDATVDEDYGLDFTFRNTTGNWLALETGYDGQNMRVALKGIDPGWKVNISGPSISNVKPADPTPVEREDPSFPPGKRVQVESARDGMDVSITRTVTKDGQVIDQRTFSSHYEPSQNVTLVGPAPPKP